MSFRKIGYFVGAVIAATVLAMPAQNNETFPYRDQIVRNTQRLDNLERSLDSLQNGGSTTANILAIKVGVLESKLDATRNEVEELRRIVYGALTVAFVQFIGLALFGVKTWFNWINTQSRRAG